VIARLVDGSELDEFKHLYGTTSSPASPDLGLSRRHRRQHGILFNESALKASHFIELCGQRGIPPALSAEHPGLHGRPQIRGGRHRARRRQDGERPFDRRVPKFTVIVAAAMARAITAVPAAPMVRAPVMWPSARISVMGGEQAASVLATVRATHRGKAATGRRRGGRLQAADPRAVRPRGASVLRDGAAWTTASSIRSTPAWPWRSASRRHEPAHPARPSSASFGCGAGMSQSVLTSIEDGVATLRLNRRGDEFLRRDTARTIRDAVEAFGTDETVRVMSWRGGPAFSAGGDSTGCWLARARRHYAP